jgi:hypothetical protein
VVDFRACLQHGGAVLGLSLQKLHTSCQVGITTHDLYSYCYADTAELSFINVDKWKSRKFVKSYSYMYLSFGLFLCYRFLMSFRPRISFRVESKIMLKGIVQRDLTGVKTRIKRSVMMNYIVANFAF